MLEASHMIMQLGYNLQLLIAGIIVIAIGIILEYATHNRWCKIITYIGIIIVVIWAIILVFGLIG